MKRKKTPPSPVFVRRLRDAQSVVEIHGILSEVRYAGDIKQLAEGMGLHYLKSKRMRTRELKQWIIDNHPAVKDAEKRSKDQREQQIDKESQMLAGIDWGFGGASAVSVAEVQPDGSLKIVNAEVTPDGTRGPAGTD